MLPSGDPVAATPGPVRGVSDRVPEGNTLSKSKSRAVSAPSRRDWNPLHFSRVCAIASKVLQGVCQPRYSKCP